MRHEEFSEEIYQQDPWGDTLQAAHLEDFGADGQAEEPEEPHMPMRQQFPEAGTAYMGGSSDGWEYRSMFAGTRLAATYHMVRQFLEDEGYGDVPLPATAEDLKMFKKPRNGQLQLFGERGYIHNPIKILFPYPPAPRNALLLCVYNERAEQHLLRFHSVIR
ncbi:MAG TPA: hypothetical protein PK971_10945 [Saprospiraceae bacterium]|nr:hypothetical protein [Saprospiraceae bacterium]HND88837.1 hypothetical protein [Saprospiraceae bacterium]